MSTRIVTISEEHLAALVAARSIIADAVHHPGRAAAIAALNHLVACDSVETRYDITNREMAARLLDHAAVMGGVSLVEALQSMGEGFGIVPVLGLAVAELGAVHGHASGDTATLQRIAATRLRTA